MACHLFFFLSLVVIYSKKNPFFLFSFFFGLLSADSNPQLPEDAIISLTTSLSHMYISDSVDIIQAQKTFRITASLLDWAPGGRIVGYIIRDILCGLWLKVEKLTKMNDPGKDEVKI